MTNRRMRARMSGGVGGGGATPPPTRSGSGCREHSYGGFGGGHPHFHLHNADLRITRVFQCVARGLKDRASFMFVGCCWRRSLAADGGSGASRGHAPVMRRLGPRWSRRHRSHRQRSERTCAHGSGWRLCGLANLRNLPAHIWSLLPRDGQGHSVYLPDHRRPAPHLTGDDPRPVIVRCRTRCRTTQ